MDEKEAAKLVVETSGSFTEIWRWIMGATGAGLLGLWGHITSRVKKLEDSSSTLVSIRAELSNHIEDETIKFTDLLSKHDSLSRDMPVVRETVARIAGKLSK